MTAPGAARLPGLVDRLRGELVETRRAVHRDPELSNAEHRTAELCARRCEELGFTVRTGVGGSTGLIADLDSGRAGRTVMVRADIDALPITERGGVRPATSANPGVMHACGHDGHIAIALGVGAALAELRAEWSGRLRLCFQPAEEIAGGAVPMIEDGALLGVDTVLGVHLWSLLQVGEIAVGPGPLFGSADEFGISVRGRGGHGGLPHDAVDPVVAAAQLVVALQAVVSRETSPFSPAVVTIGRIAGGTAFNVIAEEVALSGTVRAFERVERERILQRVSEIATDVARTYRCEADFSRKGGCPPVVSDAAVATLVRDAAVEALGDEAVREAPRITVGDDVACFLERVPGCYYLVGAGDLRRGPVAPHHHPEFDIDERSLAVGLATLSGAALAALAAPG
ncbi:MAG TPA: M20 family metallopeptidase [Candidatus Dormibacteraeota bacterium]